ncbi:unnamed protein product [Effrenium voratum]|nr:unnamed protein product [Effrenium voratum]CAJ1457922.1 unnamed protein product [Effrenium voratum]
MELGAPWWYGVHLGGVLGCSAAIRCGNSAWAAVGTCALLGLCLVDWHLARRQVLRLWDQVALPLRVAACAEQLGEKPALGSLKDWLPLKRWTMESPALAALLCRSFVDAKGAQRFAGVRAQTNCLFAAKARVWGNDWDEDACGKDCTPEALLAANVTACVPRLLRFCLMVKQGAPLDGFVFEVRGQHYSADLPAFARTVRQVLTTFSGQDPAGAKCISSSKLPKRGWYFQFAREPIFVTTFAPCYGSSNPRYQFNECPDSCFVLFQPEESFLRHDLPPDKARKETNWEQPADVRDRIRVNFQRHGREYRIPETTSYPPAEFIVAPLDALNDPPVRFWQSD